MMKRLLLSTIGLCFFVAATLAEFAPLFAIPARAQETGCKISLADGDDIKAQEHWVACNEELVIGQLRYGLPEWVNPGTEWRDVSAHKSDARDASWSVCGEVRQREGLGRFGEFQRFISRGDGGLVVVENLYAEQDNYIWWRKMPFNRLWARYCE